MSKSIRKHFWAILLLVVLFAGSSFTVRAWKARHPGSMSVLESQAMDMTTMKPPVGAAPVETEVVHSGPFVARVTYTGSVAPWQEQVIYPRVEGYLKSLTVYNGDRVTRGQLIAVVDSPDLQSKVAEAIANQAAAATQVPTAQYNAARAKADYAASQAEIEAASSDLAHAKAGVTAAEKAVAQRQQDVKSAGANLDYWQSQIVREKTLYEQGFSIRPGIRFAESAVHRRRGRARQQAGRAGAGQGRR